MILRNDWVCGWEPVLRLFKCNLAVILQGVVLFILSFSSVYSVDVISWFDHSSETSTVVSKYFMQLLITESTFIGQSEEYLN